MQPQLPLVFDTSDVTTRNSASGYAMGYTDAEHERLIRQAARIAPITERLFREAGIAPGHRVLDLGSGVGDVALLVARMVGPSGEVVCIERDASSIGRAKARVAAAGLRNVSFTQADLSEIASDKRFDAAVGRFILMYLPDPVSVLRPVSRLVRPGGVLAFQEPLFALVPALAAHLPLSCAVVSIGREALLRTGANPDMGLALYRIFQEAELPAPTMTLEVPLGRDREFIRWLHDGFCSLRPQIEHFNLSLEKLGDLDALPQRLQSEVEASETVAGWMGLFGAWCHKPATKGVE
jgi:2-polyprenyl-3-methyl-5-hydroxy-6-metoxy-1,4-benzoquinol methylase